MQLPTATDLVRAFVKDLGNVFDGVSSDAPVTIPLYLYVVGTTTVVWICDADYFVLNCIIDGPAGINTTVAIDNSTYASNHQTGVVKKGAVLATFAGLPQTFPQKTPISTGQRVSINNASAQAAAVILMLTPR
jgi:hypothetical protein